MSLNCSLSSYGVKRRTQDVGTVFDASELYYQEVKTSKS